MTLAESRAWCRRVARTRARNFYYSFLLLDRERRDAMCAVYAFMRRCDDLTDEPGAASAAALARWRHDLDSALAGAPNGDPVWPAFCDAVRRYAIPHGYFHDMIDGVGSDLQPRVIETFEELYDYCYHVASVAGMSVTHILGFDRAEALPLAEKCGIAFQLTNILRDVREDASMGRCYLPAEDLRRFGVERGRFEHNPAFVDLMRFQASRARTYYKESEPLTGMIHSESRPALQALISIYRTLLDRIEASNFEVLKRRIRVPVWQKLWILCQAAPLFRRAR